MGRTAKPILRKITEEEKDAITECLLHNNGLIIKKYKSHAVIWCGQCNTEERVSLETARQIEKSHICPFCFQKIELHKEKFTYFRETLVRIGDTGYYCRVAKNVGRKPKIYTKQVAYWQNGFFARNIMKGLYTWKFRPDSEWNRYYGSDAKKWTKWRKRTTRHYHSLDMDFKWYEYMTDGFYDLRSKREFLESLHLPDVKSNQKKIIIDNLLNREQILAILVFDLKNIKQVYKYNAWINKQGFLDIERRLNVYWLDYLSRNKISYRDFTDFLNQCEELKIKPYKPQDFYKVHAELADEVKIVQEKNKNRNIKKIANKLMEKAYEKGNVQIRPLMDVRDVVETGAALHNCIKSYIPAYAKGKTDLFCLKDKGVRIVAIEVKDGKLLQARADHNLTPSSKYTKIIKQWMEEAYA